MMNKDLSIKEQGKPSVEKANRGFSNKASQPRSGPEASASEGKVSSIRSTNANKTSSRNAKTADTTDSGFAEGVSSSGRFLPKAVEAGRVMDVATAIQVLESKGITPSLFSQPKPLKGSSVGQEASKASRIAGGKDERYLSSVVSRGFSENDTLSKKSKMEKQAFPVKAIAGKLTKAQKKKIANKEAVKKNRVIAERVCKELKIEKGSVKEMEPEDFLDYCDALAAAGYDEDVDSLMGEESDEDISHPEVSTQSQGLRKDSSKLENQQGSVVSKEKVSSQNTKKDSSIVKTSSQANVVTDSLQRMDIRKQDSPKKHKDSYADAVRVKEVSKLDDRAIDFDSGGSDEEDLINYIKESSKEDRRIVPAVSLEKKDRIENSVKGIEEKMPERKVPDELEAAWPPGDRSPRKSKHDSLLSKIDKDSSPRGRRRRSVSPYRRDRRRSPTPPYRRRSRRSPSPPYRRRSTSYERSSRTIRLDKEGSPRSERRDTPARTSSRESRGEREIRYVKDRDEEVSSHRPRTILTRKREEDLPMVQMDSSGFGRWGSQDTEESLFLVPVKRGRLNEPSSSSSGSSTSSSDSDSSSDDSVDSRSSRKRRRKRQKKEENQLKAYKKEVSRESRVGQQGMYLLSDKNRDARMFDVVNFKDSGNKFSSRNITLKSWKVEDISTFLAEVSTANSIAENFRNLSRADKLRLTQIKGFLTQKQAEFMLAYGILEKYKCESWAKLPGKYVFRWLVEYHNYLTGNSGNNQEMLTKALRERGFSFNYQKIMDPKVKLETAFMEFLVEFNRIPVVQGNDTFEDRKKSIILLQSFEDKPIARYIWKEAAKCCTSEIKTRGFLDDYKALTAGIRNICATLDGLRVMNPGYLTTLPDGPMDRLMLNGLEPYYSGLKAYFGSNPRIKANKASVIDRLRPKSGTKGEGEKKETKGESEDPKVGKKRKRGQVIKTACFNCRGEHRVTECPKPCIGPSKEGSKACPGEPECHNKMGCYAARKGKVWTETKLKSKKITAKVARIRVAVSKGGKETRPVLDFSIGNKRFEAKLLLDSGATDGVGSTSLLAELRKEFIELPLLSLNQIVEVELVSGIVASCIGIVKIPSMMVHLPDGASKEFIDFHCAIYEGEEVEIILGNNILEKIIGINIIQLLADTVETKFNCAAAAEDLRRLVNEEDLTEDEVRSRDPGLEWGNS